MFTALANIEAPRTGTTQEKFENRGFTLKTLQKFFFFWFTLRRRNFKTQHSPVILELCLRKTLAGKSHDCPDVIVFEKH